MATAGGADECDYLELLIASERVAEWVEDLFHPGDAKRRKSAVMQIAAAVESRAAYAEEARRQGIVASLTRLLSTTGEDYPAWAKDDDEVMDAICKIMTACSGPMASGGKVSDFTYASSNGGDSVTVRIREGALGDGLGAKVWTVAHMMCRELVDFPEFVRDRRVLEIGAGCGVCGIVGGKLGAQEMVLSDVEGSVLRILRDCMLLNAEPASGSTPINARLAAAASGGSEQPATGKNNQQGISDQELFDDAESVDDLDFGELMLGNGNGDGDGDGDDSTNDRQRQQAAPGGGSGTSSWDAGNVCVRLLDWAESEQILDAAAAAAGGAEAAAGSTQQQQAGCCSGAAAASDEGEMPPGVAPSVQYQIVIGTDIMYEPAHARLVAAVVAHRLAPGGCALLCCAVREQRTFDFFITECARRGLRYRHRQVQPSREHGGILGKEHDYEGGWLFMAVDHAHAPGTVWHREDFVVPPPKSA